MASYAQIFDNGDTYGPDWRAVEKPSSLVLNAIKETCNPEPSMVVETTRKRFTQTFREALRSVTGLGPRKDVAIRAPVSVVDEIPQRLAVWLHRLTSTDLWLLCNARKFINTHETLSSISEHQRQFEHDNRDSMSVDWDALDRGSVVMDTFAKHAMMLIEEAKIELLLSPRDSLGLYFYGGATRIELRWIPIWLTSRALDLSIEHITLIVLAHELAHAYTHQGADTDGHVWGRGFGASRLHVVEGLAQYYAEVLCTRAIHSVPGLDTAFQRLLAIQKEGKSAMEPYTWFEEWAPDHPRRSEVVRNAMLIERRRPHATKESFEISLARASTHLGVHPG